MFSPPAYGEMLAFHEIFCPLIKEWKRIVLIGAVMAAFGFLLSFFITPSFYASALVRVEPEITTSGEQTTLAAEAEIITARSTLEKAIKAMGFHATIAVDALPLSKQLGYFWADIKRKMGLLDRQAQSAYYPWLTLDLLNVPPRDYGRPLTLTVTGEESFDLFGSSGTLLLQGTTGDNNVAKAGDLSIAVNSIDAPVGTSFTITPLPRNLFVDELKKSIGVSRKGVWGVSGLIEISFHSETPLFSEYFLHHLVQSYVDDAFHRSSYGKLQTLKKLEDKLAELEESIRKASMEFTDYRVQNNILDLSAESQFLLKQVTDLEEKLIAYQMQRRELGLSRGDAHPQIQILDRKIQLTSERIAHIDERIAMLPKMEQDYTQLKRQLTFYEKLYENTMDYYAQARPTIENITGYARIVSHAAMVPFSSLKWSFIFALIAGALSAGAYACIVIIRNLPLFIRLSEPEQLADIRHIPVIASIPHTRVSARDGVTFVPHLLQMPDDPAYIALQDLARRWKHLTYSSGYKSVVMTGIDDDQGTTFTAMMLAALNVREGRKTILINAEIVSDAPHHVRHDADTDRLGFTDVLVRQAKFSECIVKFGLGDKRFDYLPPGTRLNNHRLLMNRFFIDEFLSALDSAYDCIIISAPSLKHALTLDDYAMLSGTLLVVARCGTRLELIHERTHMENMGGLSSAFFIVNDCQNL